MRRTARCARARRGTRRTAAKRRPSSSAPRARRIRRRARPRRRRRRPRRRPAPPRRRRLRRTKPLGRGDRLRQVGGHARGDERPRVDARVAGPAVRNQVVAAREVVLEAETRAAEAGAADADRDRLVEPGGAEVARVRLGRQRLAAALLEAGVAAVEAREIVDAGDLEPHEVRGVVGDALRVGLGEPDAHLGVELKRLGHGRVPRLMRLDFERLFRPRGGAGFPRMPSIAAEGMVATSHPLATRAGLRALEEGGNAVDAALAAAAVLPVVEPNLNGLGGDCFAQVWHDGELVGLNGSGRSPAALDHGGVDRFGPRSVTVPGAVAALFELGERFGRLGLDAALGRAADLAERGVAATARVATLWQRAEREGRAPFPAPQVAERYRLPELAATLGRVADEGPDGFYRGDVARAIASATWLDESDLAAHRSDWVEPLRLAFGAVEVCELPPNTQGVAALVALRLLGNADAADLDARVRAVATALAAAHAHVGDGPLPDGFLDRAFEAQAPGGSDAGDTTYLCAV